MGLDSGTNGHDATPFHPLGPPHSGVAPRGLSPKARVVWRDAVAPKAKTQQLRRGHEPYAIVACEAIAAGQGCDDRLDVLIESIGELVQLAAREASPDLFDAVKKLSLSLERGLESAVRLRSDARHHAKALGVTLSDSLELVPADEPARVDPMAELLADA